MPNPSWIESARLPRNHLLKLAIAAPIAWAAALLPAGTSAQRPPQTHNEYVLTLMDIGKPTQLLYSTGPWAVVDESDPDYLRLRPPSPLSDRPHLVVGTREKEGKIQYIRRITHNTFFAANIKDFTRWDPDYRLDPPKYHKYQPAGLYETQVATRNNLPVKVPVVALTIRKDSGEVMESSWFLPDTPRDQIAAVLDQGDYPPSTPKAGTLVEPTAAPKTIFLARDGIDSRFTEGTNPLETTFKEIVEAIGPICDATAVLGYNGGKIDETKNPPTWVADYYSPEDTRHNFLESVRSTGDAIKGLSKHYKRIILGGYSLGGLANWEYLRTQYLADNSLQGIDLIAIFLDSPLNGLRRGGILRWAQTYSLDTTVANSSADFVYKLGEKQATTKQINMGAAEVLRSKRKARLYGWGNRDGCLITPDDFIIPGVIDALPLGRGDDGVLSCDLEVQALLSPFDIATRLGHTQVLGKEVAQQVKQVING